MKVGDWDAIEQENRVMETAWRLFRARGTPHFGARLTRLGNALCPMSRRRVSTND